MHTDHAIHFDIDAACERVIHFYQTLSPHAISGIGALYAPDARFKDPFNAVVGTPAIISIFTHMFAAVDTPRFVVTSRIASGHEAMLGWDFHLRLRSRDIVIRGVSHLRFDASGRVCMHRDYWDAAEELYEKLPLVGTLMRALRQRLAAPARG